MFMFVKKTAYANKKMKKNNFLAYIKKKLYLCSQMNKRHGMMFNFTPPHSGNVVNIYGLFVRNAKGGA